MSRSAARRARWSASSPPPERRSAAATKRRSGMSPAATARRRTRRTTISRLGPTGARSDAGRVRDNNEDRYLVREERGITLLAVADGVGGSSGGEIAADAALAELDRKSTRLNSSH